MPYERVGLAPRLLAKAPNRFRGPTVRAVRVENPRQVHCGETRIERSAPAREPPGFEQIIATQASQIVARLLARLQYSSPAARDMESRIRRACLHILQNAEQMIDTPQLSRDLGISHSAFRNHFKQITGLPPGQYQIHIRLNKARRLLRNSTLSIQEIAEQLGFESIYYFSRLFKKKTGCSPLAYRKQT
ncbi:AraC family transcriptional regulator [Opitutales bacterium]|nr:AraC family transcriptional regulator [Opitutales bacterium]MDB2682476.1 AraC family transcriptional regulator [Opitutales bacterium]